MMHKVETAKLSTIFSTRCLLVLVGLIIAGSACGPSTPDSGARVPVATITLAPASVSLAVG